MYHFTYSKVVAEGPQTTRAAEREVLLQSVELMEQAESAGTASREAIDAVFFVSQLWCHLIEDLGSPDNHLPNDIRASARLLGCSWSHSRWHSQRFRDELPWNDRYNSNRDERALNQRHT